MASQPGSSLLKSLRAETKEDANNKCPCSFPVQFLADPVSPICFSNPLSCPPQPILSPSSLIHSPSSLTMSLLYVPPLIFPFLTPSVTTTVSPLPSLIFSLSLLFILSVIVRKMYRPLCSSPPVSLVVWVMVLSFSRCVAVWRALEQHESDAPERHNCSLIGKSICHEFLIFSLISHSHIVCLREIDKVCTFITPSAAVSITATRRSTQEFLYESNGW